jgi:hypothetical protein
MVTFAFIEDNVDDTEGGPSMPSLLQEGQESALWIPS